MHPDRTDELLVDVVVRKDLRWVAAIPLLVWLVLSIGVAIVSYGSDAEYVSAEDGSWTLVGIAVCGGLVLGLVALGLLMVVGRRRICRVRVTPDELLIDALGPTVRVSIAEIREASIGASGIGRRGLGVRLGIDGTTWYTLFGDNRRALIVERSSQAKLVLVCQRADDVLAALERARDARGLSALGQRD